MRALLLLLLLGCGSSSPTPVPAKQRPTFSCLADGLGEIRSVSTIDTECTKRRKCTVQCEQGSADACMQVAYALQLAERDRDADLAFARSCTLGLAIGCTNYGAALWAEGGPGRPACAKRLFDRACAASEKFGCGMFGRMLAEAAETDSHREEARRFFDRACSNMGAMICRMYAFHLENGDLGTFDKATVNALMLRACNTGDETACGAETASETFE